MAEKADMHIDSYQFGKIVIDGVSYTKDCLILGGAVKANWRREEGHSLSVADLQEVIEAKPAILIIGCGASGMMDVPEKTMQALKEQGIQVEVYDTHRGVQRFNELSEENTNAAAALHLTC
jgi:hypothetical protein